LPPPKKKGGGGDAKVILDSNVFTYLHPSTFDKDLFIRGHPTVYSEDEMVQFDANYQKQLSFNFLCNTRNSKEGSRYILEDLLSHQVGCRFIVCIRESATRNPTEASYSDQAFHIVEQRKRNNQTGPVFRFKSDPEYAHHVFRQFTRYLCM
jgi:hypothetical protein